jgi:hypothetical protein
MSVMFIFYCNAYEYLNVWFIISLLSTSYKILSNILLSRLSPYIDVIIGDHQCGFRLTDQLLIRFLHSSNIGNEIGVQ